MVGFIKNARGEALQKYLEKYVYSWETYEDYLELIGSDKIKALENNPSTVLTEPFARWVYPAEKVNEFLAAHSA